MVTIFGHIMKEDENALKETIARGIVNMIRIARGNTVTFTYKQLLRFSDTSLSQKLMSILENERKASLGIVLTQLKYYMTILNDKGVVSKIEKNANGYRYFMYKNEFSEFWELAKNNPDRAVKLLMDLMDGGE